MKSEESKDNAKTAPLVIVERSIDAAFFGLGYLPAKPVEVEAPLSEYEMVEQRIMREFF